MADYIDDIINRTIGVEGGYVNDPKDPGGETIWGITVATARRNGFVGQMKNMTKAQAAAIYRSEYFMRPGYDRIGTLSEAIAEEMFDTGVNMGVGTASTFLQRALNVLNREGKDYADLKVDGDFGTASMTALAAYLKLRGKDGELVLLTMLNALQGARYVDLAERKESNERFLYGWFKNRVVI